MTIDIIPHHFLYSYPVDLSPLPNSKSKSPKVKVEGVPVKVKATDTVETTFDTWPSTGLTETESERVAVNGVRLTLQKKLCDENEDIQDPECLVTAIVRRTRRRQLDERGRSLQEVILTDWTITFSIQCTGTCDTEAAQAQAAAAAAR